MVKLEPGQKINEWTLVDRSEAKHRDSGGGYAYMWVARCSCGRYVHKHVSSLQEGGAKSCSICAKNPKPLAERKRSGITKTISRMKSMLILHEENVKFYKQKLAEYEAEVAKRDAIPNKKIGKQRIKQRVIKATRVKKIKEKPVDTTQIFVQLADKKRVKTLLMWLDNTIGCDVEVTDDVCVNMFGITKKEYLLIKERLKMEGDIL